MENAIALVMTVLVLGLVGIPLLRERKPEEDLLIDEEYEDSELNRLLSKKETTLEAIRELEFDHAVGSLSDEDYQELKEKYERKAISVLKNLKEAGAVGVNDRDGEDSRRLAKVVRARQGERRRAGGSACRNCGAPHGDEDRFCASCGAELGDYEYEDLTCSECGEPYEEGDSYCASCGSGLGMIEEGLATDGEYCPEGFANEKAEEAVPPENPDSVTRRKRQTRRPGKRK